MKAIPMMPFLAMQLDITKCNDCHDSHSLELKLAECATCHTGVATVDDVKEYPHGIFPA